MESTQVYRIYLDELGNIEDLPLELGLLLLRILKESEAPASARYLLNLVPSESIIELITKILSYRFTNLTRLKIEAMLGISFETTRFYQDMKEEGRQEDIELGKRETEILVVFKFLTKKFGKVHDELRLKIQKKLKIYL